MESKVDELEGIVEKCEEYIRKIQIERQELIKTIEALIDDRKTIEHINCKLFHEIRMNIDNINLTKYIDFLYHENYEDMIHELLFKDQNKKMLIKYSKNYLYINNFGNISLISYNDLSNLIFTNIEKILNVYIKMHIRNMEEHYISIIETNKRSFFKNKDIF